MDTVANQSRSQPAEITWGRAERGLRLGIGVRGEEIDLRLENVGADTLEVLSHVQADETHLDWFRLTLIDASAASRTLQLSDDRDKSGPVRVKLAPGASIIHQVDVPSWSARAANGAQQLSAGTYQISATYETPSGGTSWSGALRAGPVSITLTTASSGARR
jgi:hypothetical protein